MVTLSIVIPCYKSKGSITNVALDLIETLSTRYSVDEYEIILVNDASPDSLELIIENLTLKHKNIKAVSLSKNFGQHAAIMAGFNFVRGKVIVCLDDDGQTPAKDILKLIDLLSDDCDIAYAEYPNKKHSLFRNFLSQINNRVSEFLLDKPKELYVVSYFAAKRFVIDEVIKYQGPYPYLPGLMLRVTRNIKTTPVDHLERLEGNSSYTFRTLVRLWLNEFTSFSVKPLRIASIIGMLLALIGFFFGMYTFINKLINPEIMVGYSSIQASIMFIGGMILIMLGLIGEYIGRIYITINNSPQYIIKSTKNIQKL